MSLIEMPSRRQSIDSSSRTYLDPSIKPYQRKGIIEQPKQNKYPSELELPQSLPLNIPICLQINTLSSNSLYLPRQLGPQQPRQSLPFLIVQFVPLSAPEHHPASLCRRRRRVQGRPGDDMEMDMRDLLRGPFACSS